MGDSHCALLSAHYTMRNAQCVVHSAHAISIWSQLVGLGLRLLGNTGASAGEVDFPKGRTVGNEEREFFTVKNRRRSEGFSQ